MKTYIYQPEERIADFESALASLRRDLTNRVIEAQGVVDGTEDSVLAAVLQGLNRLGIKNEPFSISQTEYLKYRERAGYAADYYPESITEKSLEHYLTLSLLQPNRTDLLIDIAAEGSPLHEIASRLSGCRAYAQDIMYSPGINGTRIGGDACTMPLPEGFASRASLTCSLEHFEGDADMLLFRELARVLRPGGRVVVVPLYLWHEPMAITDPTVSAGAEVNFDPGATIYAVRGWNNRHGRFYAPETLHARLLGCPGFRFTVLRLVGTERMSGVYARWALVADRIWSPLAWTNQLTNICRRYLRRSGGGQSLFCA